VESFLFYFFLFSCFSFSFFEVDEELWNPQLLEATRNIYNAYVQERQNHLAQQSQASKTKKDPKSLASSSTGKASSRSPSPSISSPTPPPTDESAKQEEEKILEEDDDDDESDKKKKKKKKDADPLAFVLPKIVRVSVRCLFLLVCYDLSLLSSSFSFPFLYFTRSRRKPKRRFSLMASRGSASLSSSSPSPFPFFYVVPSHLSTDGAHPTCVKIVSKKWVCCSLFFCFVYFQ